MLPATIAFAVLAALPHVAAMSPQDAIEFDNDIIAKAKALNSNFQLIDVNPSSVYAPYKVECPANLTWVRPAKGLSDGETEFLKQRASKIDEAITTLMKDVGLPKPSRNPVIGISMSGGGYRAMINTLGQAQALMKGTNGTGGWMDAVTYMAGLSGGSWAAGSFVANGGAMPTDLNANIWDMDFGLLGPSGNNSEFLSNIAALVSPKHELGFPVQVSDIWGISIAQHVLPREHRMDTNPNMTISGLPSNVPAYGNGSLPMPIIIAASIDSPLSKVENGTPIYEYTPYEFGTWDASNTTDGGYFTPVEWLGSDPNNNTCYRGYDQMSFIVGVSATLFNAIPFPVTQMFPNTTFPFLNASTANVATVPNPFEGYNGSENPDPNDTQLTLVDAGETNQNLPLLPLIVPARKVDAIIALDASNDVNAWPNGAALYTTYTEYENNTEFMMPAVPSPNGFINGGFNTRPTFFGCNDTQGPLVVYIPNYPYSALTNITTMTLQQATNLTDDQLRSSLKTVTLNGTVGAWPTCLACALTDRANNYSSASRSANCAKCFDAFCWNGEDNTTAPAAYYPAMGVPSFLQNLNLTLDATKPDNAASAVAVGKAFAVVAAGAAVWIAL